MNILCVGDIVGEPGRNVLEDQLPKLAREFHLDTIIVNAENAAGGFGLTAKIADDLLAIGCDVITLGDHVWDKRELMEYLVNTSRVIRPANFPNGVPGQGWCIARSKAGTKFGVINLLGRVFMRYNVDCPFKTLKTLVEEIRKETKIIMVDMHAEATSEKMALGFYIDGTVSAVFGTHTHIQTADEKILPQGTAYITDLGMTGPYHSVIGQRKEYIIDRFLTSLPNKFEVATEDVFLCGAVVEVDEKTGLAEKITRVQRPAGRQAGKRT